VVFVDGIIDLALTSQSVGLLEMVGRSGCGV